MAFTPAQLKTEIDTDPTGLGLVALRNAGNFQGIADALTLPRAGITIERLSVPVAALINALAPAEYVALTQPQRDYLALLPALVNVDIRTGSSLRNALNTVFAAGTTTRANYTALASKTPASRAEQLFGEGTRLTHGDVSAALAG